MCEHVATRVCGRGPECKGCGARQMEEGVWGPTLDQRIVRLSQLERLAEKQYELALTYCRVFEASDGRRVEVRPSKEGQILFMGDERTREEEIKIARSWDGLAATIRLRDLASSVLRGRADL